MSAYARLSVNINDEGAEALRESMRRHGISATEATRRALDLLRLSESGDLSHLCSSCDESIERCSAYHPEYGFVCVIPVRGHGGTHFDRAGGHWTADGQVLP